MFKERERGGRVARRRKGASRGVFLFREPNVATRSLGFVVGV